MKVIIVEDELASQACLQQIVEQHFPEILVVAIADNVSSAVAAIREHRPHIVFLDVEIKLGTGFDVLEQTKGMSFEVIFTTAFNTFAVDAFRHHAIDYLLKPLNTLQVGEAIRRCMQRIESNDHKSQVDKLLQQLQQPEIQKLKLSIPTLEGLEFIEFQSIIYGEAQGNYTNFRLKSGAKITATRKLKEVEEMLPAHIFFRIHHSYIINLQYLKKYHKGRGGYVVMENDTALPVSFAKKEEFLNWIG